MNSDEIGILVVSLRALANAAPAAPWHYGASSGYDNPNISNDDGPLASTGNAKRRTRTERAAFARYVAQLDPDMIRTIADTLEQLLRDRNALVAGLEKIESAFNLSPR